MKRIVLLTGLALLCLFPNKPAFAVARAASGSPISTKEIVGETAIHKTRKAAKMGKRLNRMKKKFKKKMQHLRQKSIRGGRIGLNFIGLTVLLVGGLFIALGLAIPYVGILFTVIGIIVAFVGLLLLLLLGGVSVEVD